MTGWLCELIVQEAAGCVES
jgi:hypothetical protein